MRIIRINFLRILILLLLDTDGLYNGEELKGSDEILASGRLNVPITIILFDK